MSVYIRERARYAALTRSRTVDDPDLLDAQRKMRAAKLTDVIEAAIAEAPPLTEDQKEHIARLLQPRGTEVENPTNDGGSHAA